MILEKLQMREFRCYNGLAEVNFASGAKNATVILGTNGAGKTSILRALNFVLYGMSATDQNLEAPLISNSALKGSHADSPARANVTLHFRHDGISYQLSRSLKGFSEGERVRYLPAKPEDLRLTFRMPDGNTERDDFPQQRIEQMLPSPIKTFFLFDGDRIADFTKPGRERDKEIRKAVNDVLHIEALSRAAERTAKIASDKMRQLERTNSPEIKKVMAQIDEQARITDEKRRIAEELQGEVAILVARIDEIDGQLIAFGEVAKLAGERRDLDKRRQGLIERARQLREAVAKATVAAVPALLQPAMSSTIAILDKYKSKHEIPARIADYFLRDLINRHVCICGRPVEDGSHEHHELEALLNSLVPNSIQDRATELLNRLRPLEADSKTSIYELLEILRKIKANGTELARIDKELERIGGDIDASAYDRSIELNKERRSAGQRVMDLKHKGALADRDAKNASHTKKALEERLKTEALKAEGLKGLQREWAVAKECAEALQRARAELEGRLRVSLGDEATDILRKLVSDAKSYFFSQVKVDADFLLRVLDLHGRDVRSQLSSGETQVSSLAFMLAMTRLGGQEAPLVVDTPLARLDVSVRGHAAHWLPQLSSQLVLLVTDAEYESAVQAELKPFLGNCLRLVPSVDGTQIEVA